MANPERGGSSDPVAGQAGVRPQEREYSGRTRLLFRGEAGESYTQFKGAAQLLLDDRDDRDRPRALKEMLDVEPLYTLASNRPVRGFTSVEDLWTVLDAAYGNDAEEDLASTELEHLRQGAMPIGEFIQKFEKLCGLCTIPERLRASMFRNKVVFGIKDRLEVSGVTTYSQMKAKAWQFAPSAAQDYKRQKRVHDNTKKDQPRWQRKTTTEVATAKGGIDREDRPPITCYNCQKKGHMARDCESPKKERTRGGKAESGKGKGPAPPTGDESEIEELE